MVRVLIFCRECSGVVEEERHLSEALKLIEVEGKYTVSKDETLIIPRTTCDRCKSLTRKP